MPDAFEILGIEPRFDLSPDEVRRAWLARSAEAHPDRAGSSDDAARLAARFNEARASLDDPERRARALLARLGVEAKADSPPPDLLMEFMEAKEAAEEAEASGDRAELSRWRAWAQARREAHVARVAELFREALAGDREALRSVGPELGAWRYAERFLEQLDAPARESE